MLLGLAERMAGPTAVGLASVELRCGPLSLKDGGVRYKWWRPGVRLLAERGPVGPSHALGAGGTHSGPTARQATVSGTALRSA